LRLSLFPLLFLGYLLLEIAGFILVGDAIGVLPTLGLILLSGFVGIVLMRVQGFGVLTSIRGEQAAGRVPGRQVLHGFMILLAGTLLLLPGFVTDVLGLLLFLPPVRNAAWNLIKSRITILNKATVFRRQPAARGGVVDLDDRDFHRTDTPEQGNPLIDRDKR